MEEEAEEGIEEVASLIDLARETLEGVASIVTNPVVLDGMYSIDHKDRVTVVTETEGEEEEEEEVVEEEVETGEMTDLMLLARGGCITELKVVT